MGDLERLAGRAGIAESYWDIFGGFHETSPQTNRALLAAMGFDVGSEAALAASLKDLEERDWRRRLAPVSVLRQGTARPAVRLALAEAVGDETLRWQVRLEEGAMVEGEFRPGDLEQVDERHVDGKRVAGRRLSLPADIAEGYHRLAVEGGGERAESDLIVAPPGAYRPDWLEGGERLWGLACHLYAVTSKGDWGIGDFTGLKALRAGAAGLGASVVGVNPLHALFPGRPGQASPYSPSSRLFLNPLYLDVSAVAEFADCAEARRIVASDPFQESLGQARAASHVDYAAVAGLKTKVLKRLFAAFESTHSTASRQRDFAAFCRAGGEALRRFALFQALAEHFASPTWQGWPAAFHSPSTPEVADFATDHARELDYHLYLQWLADGQLAAAGEGGMVVGLYRDLAAAADPGGAEAWAEPDLVVSGAGFGSPPDAFNPEGQDWGTAPINPIVLGEKGYRPFIDILRANMAHAGALRIDHAMGLQRQFWIPRQGGGGGAYVHYPFADLLGVLALESVRNECLVVGEDLGTVPAGFRQRLAGEGVLSSRVFYFERHSDGLFKRPGDYPGLALATATTHDLPTIAGHWRGRDVEARGELGLYPSAKARREEEETREGDRRLLLAALRDQGLLDEGGEADLAALLIAVTRFLARTPAQLAMVNLDDLAGEADQLNLPGSVSEYPNWRRKLALTVEAFAADPLVRQAAAAVARERAGGDSGSSR